MKSTFPFLFIIIFQVINAQDYPIDLHKTAQYFKEIKAICDADNGKLWGDNLWAPILLIDKQTRFIVANQPDNEGLLEKEGDVYIGYFPEDKGIANSITDFGNESWMMVMHPLPEDDYNRNQLCTHELYHRLQKKKKFEFGNPDNAHLDNMDARILLKLEWTALEKAVKDETGKRNHYLTDALIFRNYRRVIYPGKDSMENILEMHEGIAEYTGRKICSKSNEEFKNNVLNTKDYYWDNKTYVRSFAYYSGLLYGCILDQGIYDWRQDIKPGSDLGLIIQKSFNIELPENINEWYEKIKEQYNYDKILHFETEREKERQEILAEYRYKFTQDTILVLHTPKPNIVFDPRELVPLDTLGTVYPTIKIIADWGILQVKSGGCRYDWKKAIVSGNNIRQEGNMLYGNGWEIKLNENWKLTKDGITFKLEK